MIKENLINLEDIYSSSSYYLDDLVDLESDGKMTDVTLETRGSTLESRLQSAEENRRKNTVIEYKEESCCDDVCRNYYKFLLKCNITIGISILFIYVIVTISLKKIPFQ